MHKYFIPQKISVLIFDIDSTLYTNTEYAHEQIDCQIRQFAALRGISAEQARTMVSDFRKKWADEHEGKKISLGNLLTNFGISIEQSIEWRKTLIEPAKYLGEDKELQKSLADLSKDYCLICVTNNPLLPAHKTLDALGVSEYITDVIGLDTTYKSKPDKEIFNLALEKASSALKRKLTPEECVSIGDRYDIDLALPLEMGMGAVLVDTVKDVYRLREVLKNN